MPLAARDIEYFLEIARQRQLGRAADRLEVTPAALSKAIRRLEDELGLPLFERSAQGMALTAFGESFAVRASRIRDEHEAALRHAGEVRAGRAGLLRIGATIAVLDVLVAPALARLQPLRPGLHCQLSVASSDELLERTRAGGLHAAIVPVYDTRPAGLSQRVLASDKLVPVARDGHPALRRSRLGVAELAAWPWVLPGAGSAARRRLEAVFHDAGVAPPDGAVEVASNASWTLGLVRTTDLICVVPNSAVGTATRGLRILPVAELHVPRELALFWRPDAHWSPLMHEFADTLKAAAPGARAPKRG